MHCWPRPCSSLPASAVDEEIAIAEYLAHFQQMGTSDSLLVQLESSIRQPARDSVWVARHLEIMRKVFLEYRIVKLRELIKTGTLEQQTAAESKIQELLLKEANQ